MSGGGGRSQPEEEHENHERWLVSYADMITVLMALFIVLFAMSQVDAKKFADLAAGLADGFGQKQGQLPLSGGAGIHQSNGVSPIRSELPQSAAPKPVNIGGLGADDKNETPGQAKARLQSVQNAAAAEYARLKAAEEKMKNTLEENGLEDKVRFRINERGLVAAVVSDDFMFENGSAVLRFKGQQVVNLLVPVLAELPDRIVAEGHANHLPMPGNKLHNSNMHLSGNRAATVVQHLIRDGSIDATRINSAGFGATAPLWPIDDPKAIAGNRRVDLVVLSPESKSVRDLLPQLAKELGKQETPTEKSREANNETIQKRTEDGRPDASTSVEAAGEAADTSQ